MKVIKVKKADDMNKTKEQARKILQVMYDRNMHLLGQTLRPIVSKDAGVNAKYALLVDALFKLMRELEK